ncbi:hypothetical protein PENTCL1PPCAC_1166, partial [Pristionchus entomophagus]
GTRTRSPHSFNRYSLASFIDRTCFRNGTYLRPTIPPYCSPSWCSQSSNNGTRSWELLAIPSIRLPTPMITRRTSIPPTASMYHRPRISLAHQSEMHSRSMSPYPRPPQSSSRTGMPPRATPAIRWLSIPRWARRWRKMTMRRRWTPLMERKRSASDACSSRRGRRTSWRSDSECSGTSPLLRGSSWRRKST